MKKGTKGRIFASKISLIGEIPETNMAARKKEDTNEGIPTQVLDLGLGQIGEEEIGIQGTEENTIDPEAAATEAKKNVRRRGKDKRITR